MAQLRSKLTVKAQTVLPKQVRQHLGLAVGDSIAYRITPQGVMIDKADATDDPFAHFDEWRSEADDQAYADL